MSWGIPGFRVGRSQHGTWWVSIGLPFGIRITRRLGKERHPPEATPQGDTLAIPNVGESNRLPSIGQAPPTSGHPLTKNQEILAKMLRKKD